MKLIDKDKLEAFLNELIENLDDSDFDRGYLCAIDTIFGCYLDTLEVKEMNLDEETLHSELRKIYASVYDSKDIEAAKHFFKLGVNTSNPLTWKDMMLIHKCIKDAMNYHLYKMMEGMEGQKVVYQEVLKRFKAQKGE